jgi:putative DNA primase/helicase
MSYDNIPAILTAKPNWVVWGVVGEPLKAPFQPGSLLRLTTIPAKSGVPETWGGFEQAALCVSRGLARGIGYEFEQRGAAPDSPSAGRIYGVDLDHVIGEDGTVMPEAREIVEQLNSYAEISPSGHGLHIFVTADNANITRHRRQGGFVEIYSNARYFTVTGNIYGGFDRIADRPAELQQIHDRYLLPEPQRTAASPYASVESPQGAEVDLQRGLVKDAVLRACWNGERRRGDESASDQALMNKLAYWCSADQAAMIAAFLKSPYFAGKDEAHQKKCRRADYLPNTAKAACLSLRSTAREDTGRYIRQSKSRNEAR